MIGSTGTFTSCKDYDDDIKDLQGQIDANKTAIDQINALINSGSVITGVDKTDKGVTVTLSNGNKFELTNGTNGNKGEDGKPGSVVTIGEMATGSSTMLTLANHLEEHQVLPELALLPFTMFQEHQAMKKGFG